MFNKAKHKTSIRMEWVNITPKIALKILEDTRSSGFPQRPLAGPISKKYADEMEAGTWHKDTADVLRLCEYNGIVAALDGQHRLKAVVLSGIAQDFWVAYGVPEDAFKYVDQGSQRTLGHVMSSAGWPSPSVLSATALMLKKQSVGVCPTTHSGADSASGTLFDWVVDNHFDLKLTWESYGGLIKKAAARCHLAEAGMTYMFYMMEKADHDRGLLLFMYLADSYDTPPPSKTYSAMLLSLDDNNNRFLALKAQQMKVRTEAQRFVQLQTIRFAWLRDINNLSEPKNKTGFIKTYNKWVKEHGEDQPWTFE